MGGSTTASDVHGSHGSAAVSSWRSPHPACSTRVVDLPDADVALALSAFRTRRHLVQRLGRVLRRKTDGRGAHLILLHASGTLEDPARGGHHGFLAQVEGVATARLDLEVAGKAGGEAVAASLARCWDRLRG